MSNVIQFPRKENVKQAQAQPKPQQPQQQPQPQPEPQLDAANAAHVSGSTLANIVHGLVGALYIVLVVLWIPVRFMLIANVVLQFFKMLFKWHVSPFDAAWPFVLSFTVLAVLTYIMATWKPKAA